MSDTTFIYSVIEATKLLREIHAKEITQWNESQNSSDGTSIVRTIIPNINETLNSADRKVTHYKMTLLFVESTLKGVVTRSNALYLDQNPNDKADDQLIKQLVAQFGDGAPDQVLKRTILIFRSSHNGTTSGWGVQRLAITPEASTAQ